MVHCQAGVGRTALLLGALYIDLKGMNAVDALKEVRRTRPSSCQWSDNYKFNPFTLDDPKKRSFVQERFLELWDHQRADRITRSNDTLVSSTMSADQLSIAENTISQKQAIFASKPPAVWDSETDYQCYICENVLSIGPFPAGSSAWKPLQRKIVAEAEIVGDANALADTPPYQPIGYY
jgi:hypothetical protein